MVFILYAYAKMHAQTHIKFIFAVPLQILLSFIAQEQRMPKHCVEVLVFSIGNALVCALNMFIITFLL